MRAMRGCTRGKLPWSPLPRVLCALSPPQVTAPQRHRDPSHRQSVPAMAWWHWGHRASAPHSWSVQGDGSGYFQLSPWGKLRQKNRPKAAGGGGGRGSSSVPAPWEPRRGDAGAGRARLRVAPPGPCRCLSASNLGHKQVPDISAPPPGPLDKSKT